MTAKPSATSAYIAPSDRPAATSMTMSVTRDLRTSRRATGPRRRAGRCRSRATSVHRLDELGERADDLPAADLLGRGQLAVVLVQLLGQDAERLDLLDGCEQLVGLVDLGA